MNSASFEVQPTENGDEISWWSFRRGRFQTARFMEKRLGATVFLTDAISVIRGICFSMDPECRISIVSRSGMFFPDFIIRIVSEKFTVEAEKRFAGGSNRASAFNYKVLIRIASAATEIVTAIFRRYQLLGPKPLSMSISYR